MARVRLITDREGLTPEQEATFDWVVESRGEMIRPFEVLLHTPAAAQPVAELGAQLRYHSVLSDHDRELVIITAAVVHGCAFEWDSHIELARAAGVRDEVAAHLRGGAEVELTEVEDLLIGFVRELVADGSVSDERYVQAVEHLGEEGVVQLTTTIGYYTLLAYVMGVAGAC